jgi:hypothetical protein
MTIRASQVIPVYPLTEDLQPGDILLVQTPIDKQQKTYKQRGFLPLDNLIRRINPTKYEQFYERSFAVGSAGHLVPITWLNSSKDGQGKDISPWGTAPTASFPTYSFSAKSGGGFSLALPVQGVPIALNLLGGQAGEGTITIADARTYGIDAASMYEDVVEWAKQNADYLRQFAPTVERRGFFSDILPARTHRNYLRVITRVYLAGKLNVAMDSTQSIEAGGSGGAPKPLDIFSPAPGSDPKAQTAEAYQKNLAQLNQMLEEGLKSAAGQGLLPGGTVKVAAASSRSVSLVETFPHPLVLGYVGFDIPIEQNGKVGPPIPTHSVLNPEVSVPEPISSPSLDNGVNSARRTAYEILQEKKKGGDPEASKLIAQLDALEQRMPQTHPCNLYALTDVGRPPTVSHQVNDPLLPNMKGKGFPLVTTYRGKLADSIEALKSAPTGADGPLHDAAFRAQELKQNEDALKAVDMVLQKNTDLLLKAVNYH